MHINLTKCKFWITNLSGVPVTIFHICYILIKRQDNLQLLQIKQKNSTESRTFFIVHGKRLIYTSLFSCSFPFRQKLWNCPALTSLNKMSMRALHIFIYINIYICINITVCIYMWNPFSLEEDCNMTCLQASSVSNSCRNIASAISLRIFTSRRSLLCLSATSFSFRFSVVFKRS